MEWAMPRSLGKWIFRGAILSAGAMPGTKPGKNRAMPDPKPERDPKPEGDPKPEDNPNPRAPEQEVGDGPGNAGQHPGMPPEIDAQKNIDRKNNPASQPINGRNMAGDRGAREPASR